MDKLGCGLSLLAGIFLLFGLIPLLGWLLWLTTLPLAILAIIFTVIPLSQGERGSAAVLGLIAGTFILFVAIVRLMLGGGLF